MLYYLVGLLRTRHRGWIRPWLPASGSSMGKKQRSNTGKQILGLCRCHLGFRSLRLSLLCGVWEAECRSATSALRHGSLSTRWWQCHDRNRTYPCTLSSSTALPLAQDACHFCLFILFQQFFAVFWCWPIWFGYSWRQSLRKFWTYLAWAPTWGDSGVCWPSC